MSPKIGRPKSDNPKNVRIEIRITENEADTLKECAAKLKTNRTAILMMGLNMVKASIKK